MLYFNIHAYLRFQVRMCVFKICRSAHLRHFPHLFAWHLQRVYNIRSTGIKGEVPFAMNNEIPRYIIIFLMYQTHLLLRDILTESVMKFTEFFFPFYTYAFFAQLLRNVPNI